MKKIITLLICIVAVQFTVVASGDKVIDFTQLPKQSQVFVEQYFTFQPIALVKMDKELFDTSYEVIFTNGNKIEFDRKGEWKDVDCKYTPFPQDIIPGQIKTYVSEKFPDSRVIKVEREKNRYEVKLLDGIELTFDSRFKLIDIDY